MPGAAQRNCIGLKIILKISRYPTEETYSVSNTLIIGLYLLTNAERDMRL